MKATIGSTDDGNVTINYPMNDGNMVGMTCSAEQAERLAHALLLQAYVSRGNKPGEKQFRTVRGWVLR